jgi:hypothetical protein
MLPIVIQKKGGGALKFDEQFRAEGLQLTKRPEMSALVAGLNFLLLHSFKHEIFSFASIAAGPADVDPKDTALFPYAAPPSFLVLFLPSCLPSCLPAFLPPFLPYYHSFLPSVPLSFLPIQVLTV